MQEQQKILSLLQTRIPDNWELAQQLAQACSISLLEILEPYKELAQLITPSGPITLESYQKLFFKDSFICTHQKVTSIPLALSKLSHLNNISFPSNQLTSMEPILFDFPKLEVLILPHNNIQQFPSDFENWEKLRVLILANNFITQLPSSIGSLKALQSFNISNNHLETLPSSIGQLAKLNSINLANNNLTTLPSEFYQLATLQFLTLARNPLQIDWQLLAAFQNLISLDLSNIDLPRSSYEELKIALPKTTIRVSEGYLY